MPRHHRQFALLVDAADAGAPPPACLKLPGDVSLPQAAAALEAALHRDPALERLELRIGDETVGVATRAHVTKHGSSGTPSSSEEDKRVHSHGTRGPGAGDGATLPGTPAGFEIIRFRCTDVSCDQEEIRIHIDDDLPTCPQHGSMELMR